MKLKTNNFLEKIREFTPQLGTWNMINAPMVSEIVASAGFDWSVIDMEHAPNDVERVMQQLQAFGAYSTVPMVRPPSTEPVSTKRLMDLGAPSLLFPMVNSAEEAAAAVAGVRYPPNGKRGMAGVHRGHRFGRISDYLERIEDETCVIVQAESKQAVENIDEIAKTPGVDGVFFGPADLATDMGFLGTAGQPEVWTVIEECAARVRKLGKPAGSLVGSIEHAERLFEKGLTFVAVGTDAGLLARSMDKIVASYKGEGVGCSNGSY
ncbi:MAG: HpcH/HpaI aldolase/citrate lyase family protein [Pseudomonadota bacterium]